MQFRFLVWDEQTDKVHLVGYPLVLTRREKQIIIALLREDYIKSEVIAARSLLPLSANSVPTHIHSINKKAYLVSGRKLIKCDHGYYHIVIGM